MFSVRLERHQTRQASAVAFGKLLARIRATSSGIAIGGRRVQGTSDYQLYIVTSSGLPLLTRDASVVTIDCGYVNVIKGRGTWIMVSIML